MTKEKNSTGAENGCLRKKEQKLKKELLSKRNKFTNKQNKLKKIFIRNQFRKTDIRKSIERAGTQNDARYKE